MLVVFKKIEIWTKFSKYYLWSYWQYKKDGPGTRRILCLLFQEQNMLQRRSSNFAWFMADQIIFLGFDCCESFCWRIWAEYWWFNKYTTIHWMYSGDNNDSRKLNFSQFSSLNFVNKSLIWSYSVKRKELINENLCACFSRFFSKPKYVQFLCTSLRIIKTCF